MLLGYVEGRDSDPCPADANNVTILKLIFLLLSISKIRNNAKRISVRDQLTTEGHTDRFSHWFIIVENTDTHTHTYTFLHTRAHTSMNNKGGFFAIPQFHN